MIRYKRIGKWYTVAGGRLSAGVGAVRAGGGGEGGGAAGAAGVKCSLMRPKKRKRRLLGLYTYHRLFETRTSHFGINGGAFTQ